MRRIKEAAGCHFRADRKQTVVDNHFHDRLVVDLIVYLTTLCDSHSRWLIPHELRWGISGGFLEGYEKRQENHCLCGHEGVIAELSNVDGKGRAYGIETLCSEEDELQSQVKKTNIRDPT